MIGRLSGACGIGAFILKPVEELLDQLATLFGAGLRPNFHPACRDSLRLVDSLRSQHYSHSFIIGFLGLFVSESRAWPLDATVRLPSFLPDPSMKHCLAKKDCILNHSIRQMFALA